MQIPGFEMLEKLGEGGMATVWKARQVSLDRVVAIKILSSRMATAAEDIARFQGEAQAAAKLKHPGIVQVYDAGLEPEKGLYYFVMEFVAGYTVGEWLRRVGRLPEKDVLVVAECVADAMEYAWGRERIVHCDIKPDNIMVDSDGTVKVADLGLARTLKAMGARGIDAHGEVMGTPIYMSPEQARGEEHLDCRSDIYSLGAMLYHLATGQALFEGYEDTDVMAMQIDQSVNDLLELNPRLSKPLCYLIEKMLAKDPAHRPKDWTALKADIQRVKRKQMPVDILPQDGLSTVRRCPQRTSAKHVAADEPVASKRTKAFRWVPIAVAASATGLVVLFVLLVAREPPARRDPSPRETPPPPPGTSPAPLVMQPPSLEEERARTLFDFARQWAADNPERFDDAIEQFGRVIAQTRGTPYAAMAETEMKRLSDLRDARIREVIEKLKIETENLRRRKEFARAAEVFEQYSGPYAAVSKVKRLSIAEQLRAGQSKLEELRERERLNAAQKLDKVLDAAAEQVVQTGLAAALDVIVQAQRDEDLEPLRETLSTAERVLREGMAAATRIPDSFAAQRGREISVELRTRKLTLVVSGVAEGKVTGRQKMGTITLPVVFELTDLSPREKLLRLGSDEDPGVPLVKGLIALEFKAYPQARKYFEKVPPVLSQRLLEQVAKREGQMSSGEAEEALSRLMQSTGLPGGTFDANAWLAAIRAKTLTREEGTRLAEAVRKYRLTYSGTEFAQTAADVLTALEKLAEASSQTPSNEPVQPYARLYDSAPLRLLEPDDREEQYAPVIRKMLIRNLRLDQDDIRLFVDGEGTIRRVELSSPFLEDLTPVGELDGVRELYASAVPFRQRFRYEPTAALSSVAPLARCRQLEVVSLVLTQVKDLSPLKGLPLKELYLRHTPVADLSPLKNIRSLRILDLHNTKVRDLSALRGMAFDELILSQCKIFDFSPLRFITARSLDVGHTQFKEGDVLRDSSVRVLNVADTRVYDFRFLATLPLENLDVSLTQIKDLSPLVGKELRSLNAHSTAVTDIAALQGMPLQWLSLRRTLVQDFSPLRGLALQFLDVAETRFNDLSLLEGMPLRHLDLQQTRVSDLAPLAGMELHWLNLEQTEVRDLSPLRGMPLHYLNCRQIRARNFSPLRGLPIRRLEVDNPEAVRDTLQRLPNLEVVNNQPWPP